MYKSLNKKLTEALSAVLPVTGVVLLLHFTAAPLTPSALVRFVAGAVMLIFGIAFFTLGADLSMIAMGERIGAHLTKSKKLPYILLVCFLIGVLITVAEPDLKVLAHQAPVAPDHVLIGLVSVGVGLFLVLSFLRVFLQIRLSLLLVILYGIVFLLAAFVPSNFLAIAFDSGGVTTGPMTVPFIMALGLGLSAVRGDSKAMEDSFGMVALCSVGPILTVLLLGLINPDAPLNYAPIAVEEAGFLDSLLLFARELPAYAGEVALALLPIVLLFLFYQVFALKLRRWELSQILVGLLYTYLGLVLFLTGANVGFMPAGYQLGASLASSHKWLLVPVGFVIGFLIVSAEPAVHVLKEQVEEITNGGISGRAIGVSLSIGVAFSVGLAMLRVLTGLSIWYFIIPGYLFSLLMTFFVPPIFTAISFDSGGVASGPLTATFLLPLAMGACEAVGGNMLTDAFGMITFVALTPIITLQIFGFIHQRKSRHQEDAPKRHEELLLLEEETEEETSI